MRGSALLLALLAPALGVAVLGAHGGGSMGPLEAVFLGLVEGVTEYLPVSSTGHLVLAQRALGIGRSDASTAFAICIQAGAIAAVLWLYRRRLRRVLAGVAGRDAAGRRLLFALLAAALPAAALGLGLEPWIERHLFGLGTVAAGWLAGGLLILLLAPRRVPAGRALEAIGWRDGLLVGLAQCLALWPGMSRSLVTILGALLVGLSPAAAVEFSFLLGLVTLGGATLYTAAESGAEMVETYGAGTLLAGFAAATLSAGLAIRWLVGWLARHGLLVFGVYRILLAALVGVLLLTGVLSASG